MAAVRGAASPGRGLDIAPGHCLAWAPLPAWQDYPATGPIVAFSCAARIDHLQVFLGDLKEWNGLALFEILSLAVLAF